LSNFRVLLLGNCQFPGNNTRKFDNFQLPGNNTWKLTKRQKCWVNFRVTIPGHFQFPSIVTRKLRNFRVTIPGNCSISGYCYPEVALKKYYFHDYLREKRKYFRKYLRVWIKGVVTMDSLKKQTSKISCYCPFKSNIFKTQNHHLAVVFIVANDSIILSLLPSSASFCRLPYHHHVTV